MSPNSRVTDSAGRKEQVLRHRVSDGGRRAAHDKPLQRQLQFEARRKSVVNSRLGKLVVAETRSRSKLASGLGARGLEQKIIETFAAMGIYAKNLLKQVAEAISLSKEWINQTPHMEELAL